MYTEAEARRIAGTMKWTIVADGKGFRRVVPSPRPLRILELAVIRLLVERQVTVICAGGGGIPVIRRADGQMVGIEAVIDKDAASALLARELEADALIMLTDVDAVYRGWGEPTARSLRQISAADAASYRFAAGSMAPKVAAACEFAESTNGIAGIGRLQDAQAILTGEAGTVITTDAANTQWWD